jgi:hypothetical protein
MSPEKAHAMDAHFLDKVRSLTQTSNNAREEAQSYAERIEDPDIKEQALRMLNM